jgi:hypothetical protein
MNKLPAIKRLKNYELALIKWKEHGGLDGQYNPHERKYVKANCPVPADFDLEGYELTVAEKIKAQILPEVKV